MPGFFRDRIGLQVIDISHDGANDFCAFSSLPRQLTDLSSPVSLAGGTVAIGAIATTGRVEIITVEPQGRISHVELPVFAENEGGPIPPELEIAKTAIGSLILSWDYPGRCTESWSLESKTRAWTAKGRLLGVLDDSLLLEDRGTLKSIAESNGEIRWERRLEGESYVAALSRNRIVICDRTARDAERSSRLRDLQERMAVESDSSKARLNELSRQHPLRSRTSLYLLDASTGESVGSLEIEGDLVSALSGLKANCVISVTDQGNCLIATLNEYCEVVAKGAINVEPPPEAGPIPDLSPALVAVDAVSVVWSTATELSCRPLAELSATVWSLPLPSPCRARPSARAWYGGLSTPNIVISSSGYVSARGEDTVWTYGVTPSESD